ncbi:sterol regulatory element-binding protein 1-like isoform X2 [Porites lutea]|uniref:sterol regulatory element-binding protein 1-like isoform X2 n=1 Tax=Porites lutea TaxID=51062 RepID=UPI003CC61B7F
MEAKMADPSGEGWPSFLGETMSDLRTNFNSDKGMNEPMIDGFDERFLDFLCGPTSELNGTTAGVNIKTEPPNSVLSPPITPPESSMAIDEDCSSFNFEDYLSKATPQQGQSVLSLLQSPIAVKQEENLNVNGSTAPLQSQNTATQQLLNLLQGQKNQQGLQTMHNTSLEQLLREPSILAPASRTPVVTAPQPSVTQQQSVITQQTPQTTPQLLQLLIQQQQQQQQLQKQQQQQLQQQLLQPKPQPPQQPAQPMLNQTAILQQLLQHLGVWPTQQPPSTPQQQVVVSEGQSSPQQQVPSPVSVSSVSSTPGSPLQPTSPVSPVKVNVQASSPQAQQMNKAGILRKAIEVIHKLQNDNARLKQENIALKMEQQKRETISELVRKQKEQQTKREVTEDTVMTETSATQKQDNSDVEEVSKTSSIIPNPLTPPTPDSLTKDKTQVKVEALPVSSCGMMDRTRVALFAFMFTFLFINPLSYVFPQLDKDLLFSNSEVNERHASHAGARTLNSIGSASLVPQDNWLQSVALFAIKWLLHGVIALAVLVRIFVFGEPVTRPHSDNAVLFWRHRNQAEADLGKGDTMSASRHLQICLTALKRPLPVSKLDVACGLIWQVMRHILHRLWIGSWLVSAAGGIKLRGRSKDDKEHVKLSAKDAAMVYHQLHQLSLTGHVSMDGWRSSFLGLAAMNLAESADKLVSFEVLSEIYVSAAIQIRSSFPDGLHFIARYFLSRAQTSYGASGKTVPASLQWLFQPKGHRFFVSRKWSCKAGDSMWASVSNKVDPIAHVSQAFREHLLRYALSSIVLPTSSDENSSGNESARDALHFLHMLNECASTSRDSINMSSSSSSSAAVSDDEVAKWWVAVGMVAVHWLKGEDEAAERFYSTVESVPKSLWNAEDPVANSRNPLAKAILRAYLAKKRIVKGDLTPDSLEDCLQLCWKSGAHLAESINLGSSLHHSGVSRLHQLAQLLCCDWLLGTRKDIWEFSQKSNPNQSVDPVELRSFQSDLDSLQKLTHNVPAALPRLYLYEAVTRLMAGANPTETHHLLQRSTLRQRVVTSCHHEGHHHGDADYEEERTGVTGEREKAAALMMACRHLPLPFLSGPCQRKKMLVEAATSLEKIGDKRALQECQQLLLQLNSVAAIE